MKKMKMILLSLVLILLVSGCTTIVPVDNEVNTTAKCSISVLGLPDRECTPGMIDPNVTQDNINMTICFSGWTTRVRPSTVYTNRLKVYGIIDYNYRDVNKSFYEEDHLIPLELGGNPTDPKNLWPQPYVWTYGARDKDRLENYLNKLVCDGLMPLTEAQNEIATDWIKYYKEYFGVING
jgi:hypothetical protein